jgi:hypothetical protein
MLNISAIALREAAELQQKIEEMQQRVDDLLSGRIDPHFPPREIRVVQTGKGVRHFTPESIEKIRAAQRRRWEKVRSRKAAANGTQVLPAFATPAGAPLAAPAPVVPAVAA